MNTGDGLYFGQVRGWPQRRERCPLRMDGQAAGTNGSLGGVTACRPLDAIAPSVATSGTECERRRAGKRTMAATMVVRGEASLVGARRRS